MWYIKTLKKNLKNNRKSFAKQNLVFPVLLVAKLNWNALLRYCISRVRCDFYCNFLFVFARMLIIVNISVVLFLYCLLF